MSLVAPPPSSPLVAAGDNDGLRRMRLRLFQILMAAVTIFIMAWCCTRGAWPAILSLVIGKHLLVAILLMGLGMGDVRRKPG